MIAWRMYAAHRNDMDTITAAVSGLADRIAEYRVVRKFIKEGAQMSRLTEKLQMARGVVGRQTAKIEARADDLIAREEAIEAQTEQAFSGHESILSDAERGLDALERQLALLSNDPLESSGGSREGDAKPPEKALQAQQAAILPEVGQDAIATFRAAE